MRRSSRKVKGKLWFMHNSAGGRRAGGGGQGSFLGGRGKGDTGGSAGLNIEREMGRTERCSKQKAPRPTQHTAKSFKQAAPAVVTEYIAQRTGSHSMTQHAAF